MAMPFPKPGGSPRILLVEDNLADITITERAFKEAGLEVAPLVLRDGQQALDYLVRRDLSHFGLEEGVWQMPDLVLLDLNLPRVTGIEVLEQLRDCPDLRTLLVVVLTTSSAPEDVRRAYGAGARSYFQKPGDFHSFVRLLRKMFEYWLNIALLPSA